MTGLYLTIFLFCLLPALCHTLDVPVESALLIKGEPVGFMKSPHRHKRSATWNKTCKEDEYNPSDKDYCCNKCPEGYRVLSDCTGEGMKTSCEQCPEGFYNDNPSSTRNCNQCTQCYSQFDQVESQSCTIKNNAVCGCPEGHYKVPNPVNEQKFTCEICTTCQNTTVLVRCKADHDTICKCLHGYYHDSARECRSCTECNGTEDCVDHCPKHSSQPPGESNYISVIVAAVLGVALLAVAVAFIVKKRHKFISVMQKKRPLPGTDVTGSTPMSAPLMQVSPSPDKLNSLPDTIFYVEDPVPEQQNKAQNSSLPLPDITLQTEIPCLNSPQVLYKVIECIPVGSWREFIRRLGVSNHVIETSEHDYRHYKDAQYAMLSVWVHNGGSSGATRDTLFRVLREMNLGGCVERIEESL